MHTKAAVVKVVCHDEGQHNRKTERSREPGGRAAEEGPMVSEKEQRGQNREEHLFSKC